MVGATISNERAATASATLFSEARDFAFVAGIYLIFAGYLYRYFYFESFGIQLSAVDANIGQSIFFAYNVFKPHIVWILISVFVLIVVYAWLSAYPVSLQRLRGLRVERILLLLIAILLFPLIYTWSQQAATNTMVQIREGNNVKISAISFTPTAKGQYPEIPAQNVPSNFAVIGEYGEFLYVLKIPGKPKDATYVYAVRKTDVATIKTLLP